jgi:hypothetical protein
MVNLDDQTKSSTLATSARPLSLAISPDGQSFGVIDGASIPVWGTGDGLPIHHFVLSVGSLLDFEYSTDGQRLVAIGSSGLQAVDVRSGQSRFQLKFGPGGEWLAAKPSGEIFASGGASNQFQMFEPGGNSQILDDSYIASHRPSGPSSSFFR